MPIKLFASALIAALLMTGTVTPVSPASGQGAQSPRSAAVETAALTEAQAVAAALEHAALTEGEVTGLRAKPDRDDRRPHWEVHFRSGDWEYDYDIDLTTGAVLEWERDYEPLRRTQPEATEPKPTQPPREEKTSLTADQAAAIALDHAGLTADQVTGLRTRRDRDDGISVYEVEFRADRYEYDYEIHAESGKILDFDKDRDD